MTTLSRMLADFSPDASVRVLASEPAMPPSFGAETAAAIRKLLAQFIREGRCSAAAATTEEDGRFLVIAWEGQPLSGCSHDKIAHVITAFEARSGCVVLAAPPIAVGQRGAIRLTDRTGLRNLLATGDCDAQTPVWNLRAATLGEWSSGPMPLVSSALGQMLGTVAASEGHIS